MPFGIPRDSSQPGLRVSAQTAKALEQRSAAVAFLVGSYDGSGNYGDIAQLDAAVAMLGRLGSELLVVPVIEQQFAAAHDELAGELIHRPEHVAYYNGGGDPGGEGLQPIRPPEDLKMAVSYLYGGGFLNPSWGARKLGMLRAVEGLLAGAERTLRFASGLQVDGEWITRLDPADTEMLRRFELMSGRDDASAEALARLGGVGAVPNAGDDAVGVLPRISAPATRRRDDSRLEVNVHFAEHEWVTDRPDSVREFDARLLSELSRLAGRPVRVRPLLAYLDPRIDERPGLERFAAACARRGIEVTEPALLRPARVGEHKAEMGDAALTVSSSYHVALTSLLLAVPAAILRDNDYYAQKALGLLSDFGLPPEFAPRSSDDPEATAAAIAPHVIDPEPAGATRRRLEAAAGRVRRRRAVAEAEMLTLIDDAVQIDDGSEAPLQRIAAGNYSR